MFKLPVDVKGKKHCELSVYSTRLYKHLVMSRLNCRSTFASEKIDGHLELVLLPFRKFVESASRHSKLLSELFLR